MSLAPPRSNTFPARRPPPPHPSRSRSPPKPESPSADLVPQRSSTPPHPNSLLHPHYLPHLLLSRSHRGPIATSRTTLPSRPRTTIASNNPPNSLTKLPPRRVSTWPFTLRTLR